MIIYLLMFLGVVAFVIGMWQQVRPWASPIRTSERLIRSLSIGVGVAISIFCLFAILDLRSKPNAINNWSVQSMYASFCFVLPLGIVASIGSYINFGVMDKLKTQVTKLKVKDKNQ